MEHSAIRRHFPTFFNYWFRLRVMRVPRVRITARRARMAVVVVAVVAALYGIIIGARWHYQRCMDTSFRHAIIGGHLALASEHASEAGRQDSVEMRRLIAWYIVMARKYRRATWQPWLLLVPDPPEPRL
jgi:hypothetical protein